jgi:hypothetical protein
MSSTETPVDPLTIPWRPTVDDVAALIRARTKDASANEVGTFTDKTRPTDAEVEQLITNGCAKVASVVGWDIPVDANAEGSHLAAIWAACEVELSYWPEQARSERSPYAQLLAMYEYDIAPFAEFVAQLTPPGAGTIGARAGTFYSPSATAAWAYQFGYGLVGIADVVNVGLGGGGSRRRR